MSNIYYWEKLMFSKLRFSRKENLKKSASFEEQKGTSYIRGNVYFDIIVFSCLSSTEWCLRFLLDCFVREIKGFYQSSLRNEVDSRDIINVSSNILANNLNFKKRWKSNDYNKINIFLPLKSLVPFCLSKKDLKTDF